MNQLSLFEDGQFADPDRIITRGAWTGIIQREPRFTKFIVTAPDESEKIYKFQGLTRRQAEVLLGECEALGDFPDIVVSRYPHYTISSVNPIPQPDPKDVSEKAEAQRNDRKKRAQSGWIQPYYKLRVDKKQITLRHPQLGASGPYYCYRYLRGGRQRSHYFRGDLYVLISNAIADGKSVNEILRLFFGY